MKTIGLLGGMSWESTMSYYKSINEGVKANLGGLNSAKICMYSVNFDEIERLQHQGRWSETANILSDAALSVEKGGADFILICTNTMHKVVPEIEKKITIPILHIADTTAQILLEQGVKKVGLLGTAFTMEQDFYKARLVNKFGIGVVIPDESDREQVHNIIYQELCRGEVKEESRDVYRQIIEKLSQQGAEAVILGCTEIALLIQQQHTDVPLLDTTSVHADAAVRLALGN
ncbi:MULTISPECIES: aspartate/glutamate racemase family protein [Vibrio]|uniref:aspartate/glutamate racemase family protein n=1 Tax=Vibrio TaxID=662 RepID=UPI000304236F|nr:aspartate/glutamate racemase family protein [Vibrio cyclitrophicus]MBY7659483.1 aspartate/glutamate racemase family protein [Vibrio atlanticus]NOH42620.1 aspartate/glutamate racemase family protein [Vibrio cyclitrophicus]OCH39829.1 aspartate/glutamate racemase [Vibrio cyclitrophicus]OED87467.1 aspartate/glutamate racemase [Vibrio cyclitrophicus ZF30]OEE18014.1 aspartate/glutamate racemase [Vibrio cyclitrophicus ZF207]